MKSVLVIIIIAVSLASCSNGSFLSKKDKSEPLSLSNNHDSLSYALGMEYARDLKSKGLDSLNENLFAQALRSVYMGDSLWLNDDYSKSTVADLERKLKEMQDQKRIQEGVDFLLENGKKDGIVSLPSGLQYEVLTLGTGNKPTAADQVTTHYEGRLIDGTIFDSSYKRGQPATFPLRGVIKGWTEALQLMPEGSKYRLYIPYELAYGPRGAGAQIPPYSTLIFDVELLQIVN